MSETTGTPGSGSASGEGTANDRGVGSGGTIPSGPTGVGVGAGEATSFEPEEDPDAVAGDPASAGDDAGQ